MKLYDYAGAPSPRRVRVFMAEKGIEIPTVSVDLRSGAQFDPEFRRINPHCTVPVLELDDGTPLCSTVGIRRYLEERFPDPPLLGRTAVEKARVADAQWRIENEGITALANVLRNSVPGMKGRALTGPIDYEQIPALAERDRRRVEVFLQLLETMAADRSFLCGENYTAADIDAMIAVDFARRLHFDFPGDADNARAWYGRVSARDSASV